MERKWEGQYTEELKRRKGKEKMNNNLKKLKNIFILKKNMVTAHKIIKSSNLTLALNGQKCIEISRLSANRTRTDIQPACYKWGKTQKWINFKSIRNNKEWRTVETTEEKNKYRFMSNGSPMA